LAAATPAYPPPITATSTVRGMVSPSSQGFDLKTPRHRPA
jgi:hypothetical protein